MSDLTMKYNPAFLDDETLIRTFVVRHREFASVMESVRENIGDANQHVLVIGPRGSGKSTLVLRVAAEVRRDEALRDQWYPVVYGEESYLVTSAGEFWLEALLQVAEQTGEPRWRQAHDDLLSEPASDRLARRALAQLMDFADERGVRLLFIVENLHQIIGSQIADDDEMWALRRTLQTEPRVMLLGTATRRFDQIDDRGQALYEFFRILDLDPLGSLDEIGDLWELAGNTDTPRAFLRPVEILTGGNPRLIRILSEFAARTSFQDLMENLVHLMDEHTEYFKHHLDRLAPKERKVFVALADRWDPGTAKDIAEVARMETSLVSAQLARLEARGAVRVVDQRGRTKVYQVAERLYNVYHLMRRRGQASARVRAAVRFMVHYYEGDRLVPAVRALVHETGALAPDQRRDHYLAYAEVLDRTEPSLRARIVAETREDLYALPDVPEDLRQRLDAEANPHMTIPLEELLSIEPASLDEEAARWLEGVLIDHYKLMPSVSLAEALLAVEGSILAYGSDDPLSHRRRGFFLAQLDRHNEALDAYDRALDLQPDHPNTHYNRGSALFILGQVDEALDAYDHAIYLQPDHWNAHLNRGITLAELDRHDEALDAYDRALDLQPDHPNTHYNLGGTLAELDRHDEALDAYDRALDLQPDHPDTRHNRGVTLAILGRYDDALRALAVLTQQIPTARDAPGLTYISTALAASGRTEATLDVLQASPLAPEIEPLLVALRLDLGETVDVAQEIEGVARDILADIETARARLSEQPTEDGPDSAE